MPEQGYSNTSYTPQSILNDSFDEESRTLVTQLVSKDSDGNMVYTTPISDVQASQLLDRLEFGMITDKTKTLLVQLSPTLVHNIGTVTAVTTVASVTNTVRQGDLQTQRLNEAILDAAFINGITNNLSF